MPVLLLISTFLEEEEMAPLAAIARRELMYTLVCPVTAATEMAPAPVVLSI